MRLLLTLHSFSTFHRKVSQTLITTQYDYQLMSVKTLVQQTLLYYFTVIQSHKGLLTTLKSIRHLQVANQFQYCATAALICELSRK